MTTTTSRPAQCALSIIIPVLDEAESIVAALRRLEAWRAEGVQVLVVDGGSADGSARLCAGFADAVLHSPRGRALQMNAGAAAAQGDVLLFLHADTRLPDGAPGAIQDALANGAHRWGRFDVSIAGASPLFPLIASLMNWRSAATGIATGDQAIFVCRDAFDAIGGFPAQPLMEDIELSRRLLALGRPARVRRKVLTSGRRWEQSGVWRTIFLMWRLRLLYWLGTPAEKLAKVYR